MPHARLDRVQAAPPPVAAPANAELHKSVHPGPSHSDDADAMSKNKLIPSSHLSLDGSSTGGAGQYGVLRAAGGALGLNKFAEDSAHDKNAKPLSKALTKFMTAHNPKTAWSHAISGHLSGRATDACNQTESTDSLSTRRAWHTDQWEWL